jgi:hypothetical protein
MTALQALRDTLRDLELMISESHLVGRHKEFVALPDDDLALTVNRLRQRILDAEREAVRCA